MNNPIPQLPPELVTENPYLLSVSANLEIAGSPQLSHGLRMVAMKPIAQMLFASAIALNYLVVQGKTEDSEFSSLMDTLLEQTQVAFMSIGNTEMPSAFSDLDLDGK